MSQPVDGHQRNCRTIVDGGTREAQKIPARDFLQSLSPIPLLTLEEWRTGLRERVSEIGQEDPAKASLLSRKILFYQGTAGEREELEDCGIQVPDLRLQGGLPGGMFGEATGLVVPLLRGEEKDADEERPLGLFNSRPYARRQANGIPQKALQEGSHPSFPSKARRAPVSSPPLRPKVPFSRIPSPAFDPDIPPEIACPLIVKKLNNPQWELSLDESIELFTTCVRYGYEYAKKIEGKEAVIVIGNTGAGKSTMVNYFSGCTMELKSSKEHNLEGVEDIVVVKPKEQGGTLDEIMPIGQTKESKTFMPQIEDDADKQFTYCDCPGFLDNRGPKSISPMP